MQQLFTSKDKVKEWLVKRGITEEVIKNSGLQWDEQNGRIIIPIKDENGVIIFNKYRKDPFDKTEAPKYKYDFGSTLMLYNAHDIEGDDIFICEGELDCLLLNSLGHKAVTSTGGAMTFRKEWADKLAGKNIYICLDNDEPGIKGAIRIQKMIPSAKWIFIPYDDCKDVTELVAVHGVKALVDLWSKARSYSIPESIDHTKATKQDVDAVIEVFKKALEDIVILQRTDGGAHLELIRKYLLDQYGYYRQLRNRMKRPKKEPQNLDDIKQIPITNFISFDRQGFAKCIFHNDKNASMKYNDPGNKLSNTVHCFSCGKTWDVISVYMQLNGLQFKEAVSALKK